MLKNTWLYVLMAALLAVGCAPSQKAPVAVKPPVYPSPPDEPRFFFERTIRGSLNVLSNDDTDKFKRILTGENRVGIGLDKPYALAVHKGRMFVGDSVTRAVMVFDVPQQKFFMIGQEEPGVMGVPLGLDVDAAGNLYVGDSSSKVVKLYTRDGKFLRDIKLPADFSRMAGVTVDQKGERVYVVEIGGTRSQNHRIIVLNAVTGEHLLDIGKRGSGPGEFNLPRDVAIAKDGTLWVVDGGNFRVQHLQADGKYISEFGKVGRQSGQFARPKEIALDAEGNIYISDAAFGNFQIFNPEGRILLAVGNRSNMDTLGGYMLPAGIAVDEDGRVYMADQFFRKIEVFRPARLKENEGYLTVPVKQPVKK